MASSYPSNKEIAKVLEEIAELLETQKANPFRINAYRRGAKQLRSMDRAVADIVVAGDGQALEELPAIGRSLARIIEEYVDKGRSSLLQRLQGEVTPEELFAQVPGIGEELAERIVHELDLHSLAELELAAHDGRLAGVEGFGERRVEAVRTSLAGMLSGYAGRRLRQAGTGKPSEEHQPSVALLLAVDREYRERGRAGELPTITPKRFNPEGKDWLPVFHTEKEEWEFTALFSNTKRAHELKKTHDWVVIYFERDGTEGQHTIVTETRGPLEGKRVVRGREKECRGYYFDR